MLLETSGSQRLPYLLSNSPAQVKAIMRVITGALGFRFSPTLSLALESDFIYFRLRS